MVKINEYDKQAREFLKKTNSSLKIEFKENGVYPYFEDEEERDIYNITLKRGEREYKFTFGNSLNDSGLILLLPNGERTRHKSFKIPKNMRKLLIDKPKDKQQALINKMKVKKWFGKTYFSPAGLKLIIKEPKPYDILASLTKHNPEDFKFFCSSYGYDEDSRKAYKIYEAVKKEYDNLRMLYNDEELKLLGEIQ